METRLESSLKESLTYDQDRVLLTVLLNRDLKIKDIQIFNMIGIF